MIKKILTGAASVLALPLVTLAADPSLGTFNDLGSSINSVTNILQRLTILVIGLAVFTFIVGVLKYVTSGGNEEKQAEARGVIVFGIIAIAVMISVWGLVNLLVKSFGFGAENGNARGPANIPTIPTYNSNPNPNN